MTSESMFPGQGDDSSKAEPRQKQHLRLVVVENDDNDVFFLERALQQQGFTCPLTRLTDGQYAIEYFSVLKEDSRPDAVLLDLKMPRKDGFDVLYWLRQNRAYDSLPIIILSSSDEPVDLVKAQELCATKFLLKRNHFVDVIQTLEELISRRAA